MKMSDRQIKNRLEISPDIAVNAGKADICVANARLAFYENEARGSLTKIEFLYQQSQYIQKRWWVLQGFVLFGLWCVLTGVGSDNYVRRCMGITAPLFVVLIIPELWKNRQTNAMEVECASFFSLRQIYAVRLMIFTAVDLIFLSVFSLMSVCTAKLTVQDLMVQFFLPFSVTCCICFQTLYSRRLHSEILSMFLCMLWSAVWLMVVQNDSIYGTVSVSIWNALLVLSALYLGYCIRRGQKKCDTAWEAGMI